VLCADATSRIPDADYNLRSGVEGTVSQAVRGPGLRHSRYPGQARAHVQSVLTGIALAITRLAAYFTAHGKNAQADGTQQCRHRRPPTRVHQLRPGHGPVKAQDAAAA
jgi:hypothetical protein